jgi:hypothetical protein
MVGLPPIKVLLAGVISNFSLLWAQLNTSLSEAYAHPLWPVWVLDLGVLSGSLTPQALRQWVDRRQVEPYVGGGEAPEGGWGGGDFVDWLFLQTQASPANRPGVARGLNFSGRAVLVREVAFAHPWPGGLRQKRARSIRRRRSKHIVQEAKRRWWIF